MDVPVTLKIRTGWNRDNRNGVRIARIAEDAGIAALAVHGRTRADLYEGEAEYETIAAIKQAVSHSGVRKRRHRHAAEGEFVLDYTKCDGCMIGRAAQGRPWIFREIAHYLATGELLAATGCGRSVRDPARPSRRAVRVLWRTAGVRIARKHLGWYAKDRPENAAFRAVVNRAETAREQLRLTQDYFAAAATELPIAA